MLSEKDKLPWYPLLAAPLAHLFPSIPHISSYSVPFSVYSLRQTTLHVKHVIHGWMDVLLCFGRNHIKCWLIWYKTPCWYTAQLEKSIPWASKWRATGVSLLAVLTLAFAVNLYSATALVLSLLCALFALLYFTVFSHLSNGRDLQAEQDWVWNSGLS